MRTSSVNQVILQTLAECQCHLTARDLFERIQPRLPAVNYSTVYRALERLAHAGMVSVSDMGLGAAVYEAVGGPRHHHLVCQGCGAQITIGDEDVRDFFDRVESSHHFHVVTNHLVLFGLCSSCAKAENNTEAGQPA